MSRLSLTNKKHYWKIEGVRTTLLAVVVMVIGLVVNTAYGRYQERIFYAKIAQSLKKLGLSEEAIASALSVMVDETGYKFYPGIVATFILATVILVAVKIHLDRKIAYS